MLTTLAIPIQIMFQLVNHGDFDSRNNTLALDISVPHQTHSVPEGYTAYPNLGVAYKYYNYSRTWNLARKDCVAHGANLAVVDSFSKINKVMELKEDNNYGTWVGVHRLYDDVEWVSVKTGSAPVSIPWAPDQTGEAEEKKKCVALHPDGRGSTPVICNTFYPFVCEIEIPILQVPAETVHPN